MLRRRRCLPCCDRSLLCRRAWRRPQDNWPEFRGPHGDGHADAADAAAHLERDRTRPLEDAHPRPRLVVAGHLGRADLADHRHRRRQADVCRPDRSRHRERSCATCWSFRPPSRPFAIPTTATPVARRRSKQGRVYIHFGSYGTAAIDTATGKRFGRATIFLATIFAGRARRRSSGTILLILTFDGFDFNYVVALDKHTGKTVWRTDRNIQYDTDDGDYHKAYVTPTVITAGGREQLVSPSAGATIAYDPATGRELWRVQSGGMNAAARPLFGHGLVFCHHRLPADFNCLPSGPTALAT